MNLIAITQIKTNTLLDFDLYVHWYLDFIKCDKLIFINDNSAVNLKDHINDNRVIIYDRKNINTNKLPFKINLQTDLYNAVILENDFKLGDIIITPDYDEFWWYDYEKYFSFKEAAVSYYLKIKRNSILFPWINISSKDVLKERNKTYIESFLYHSTRIESPVKPICFYNGNLFDTGFHLNYLNNKMITEKGSDFYIGKCDYNLDVRLYHFQYTTLQEYEEKKKQDCSTHKPRTNLCSNFSEIHKKLNYSMYDDTLLKTLHHIFPK